MGTVNPFTTIIKSPVAIYLARNLRFSEANPEGTEKISVLKVKFDDGLDMVMQSKITHGPS